VEHLRKKGIPKIKFRGQGLNLGRIPRRKGEGEKTLRERRENQYHQRRKGEGGKGNLFLQAGPSEDVAEIVSGDSFYLAQG